MKIINRGRGTGKTTMLIHTSYITGYPIIVIDDKRATQVREQAQAIGCKDIEVVSFEEIRVCAKRRFGGVLIDEATDFIEKALQMLIGGAVVGCTMTVPFDYESGGDTQEVDNE